MTSQDTIKACRKKFTYKHAEFQILKTIYFQIIHYVLIRLVTLLPVVEIDPKYSFHP